MAMPRRHPREERCTVATSELRTAIAEAIRKHDLTEGEQLRVVSAAFYEWFGDFAKWTIRAERHPDDPDRPGGWE